MNYIQCPLSRQYSKGPVYNNSKDLFSQLEDLLNKQRIPVNEFICRFQIEQAQVFYKMLNFRREHPTRILKYQSVHNSILEKVQDYLLTKAFPPVDLGEKFLSYDGYKVNNGNRELHINVFFRDFVPLLKRVKDSILFIDLHVLGKRYAVLKEIIKHNPTKLCFLYGDLEFAKHYREIIQSSPLTYMFIQPAGQRTYTEVVIDHAVRSFALGYRIIIFSTTYIGVKVTNREWLVFSGLSRRGCRPQILRYDRDNRGNQGNDFSVSFDYNKNPDMIPYPSALIRDKCLSQDEQIDTQEIDQLSSESPLGSDPGGISEALRERFRHEYPADCSINEFVLNYGLNGPGFIEWLTNGILYGDAPEAVRFYLIYRTFEKIRYPGIIVNFPGLRTYLNRKLPSIKEVLLVDQDNLTGVDFSYGNEYKKKPGRIIFLLGNDITFRIIYDTLSKTLAERSDIRFLLTPDSSRQAADKEIVYLSNYLISLDIENIRIASHDNNMRDFNEEIRGMQGY